MICVNYFALSHVFELWWSLIQQPSRQCYCRLIWNALDSLWCRPTAPYVCRWIMQKTIWLHVSFLWRQEWEAGRRRERELAGREIDRLRGSIQTLTRAANPLGKLMDFLQEDVDSMQRELATWQRTNLELMAQLRMEHRWATFVRGLYDYVVCCCLTVSLW